MGKEGGPVAGGAHTATVRLPDQSTREFPLSKSPLGEELFQQVTKDLSIEEKEYFSLCFYDHEHTRHWLYNDKKIQKQLKDLPWNFFYEVKFYPSSPASLTDDHARYTLFLQLKSDIYTGRLPTTAETQALLGSLAAQAEFGDFQNTAEYENYLQTAKLSPNLTSEIVDRIKENHQNHKGMPHSEAETRYLEICKELAMYGVFQFPAKDSKGTPVNIGVSAHGVNVYREQVRIHRFAWQNIIKVSYRRSWFSIKLKAGEIDKKEATVAFKLSDYYHAKRVWKSAVEHHTFFRLIQPEDKSKTALFRWGSARFRYHGRTQFQTKMASQMFDRPASATIPRSQGSRISQSLDNVANKVQTLPLNYADSHGSQDLHSPSKTYAVNEVAEKRKSAVKVGASGDNDVIDDDELVYLPVGSPDSAAYYTHEQSMSYGRASSAAESVYRSSDRGVRFADSQSPKSACTVKTIPSDVSPSKITSKARRRLFGTAKTESPQVKLLALHSPVREGDVISNLPPAEELNPVPLQDAVSVYSKGFYDRLSPSRGYNINTLQYKGPVSGLDPIEDMPSYPIRYFVDVKHSGQKKVHHASLIKHEGSEDEVSVGKVNLLNYTFRTLANYPELRLEPRRELPSSNIFEYAHVYYPIEEETRSTRKMEVVIDYGDRIRNLHSGNQETSSDSEVINKENVVPESYGLASTSYDGPLESTPREEDLGTAPLRDYSAVYHPGESWNVKLQKSKVKKPKAAKEPSIEDAEKKKTAVVYLKAMPKEGEEEEAEQSTAEEKEKSKKGRDWSFNPPDVHLPQWKFGGRKAKEPKEGEEVISAAYPESSDKYEGPLDTVDRKDDLEKLPLGVSPTKDTAASTTHRKYFLFGRVRHEGDEDVIDKENVVPESYGLASTSYDGPLESTPREEDLGTAPLRDYSAVYHPGESWNVKLQKSKVKKPKAEKESSIEDAEKKKTAVVYLKAVPKEGEEEEAEQSSAEEKEKSKKGRDWSFNLPDVHLPHWKFGGRKAKEPKEGEEVITAAYPGSSDKYEGPLDTVDRKDELEKLPLDVSPTKDTAASTTVRKYFLFGRVRHEGDEDVIDKENVVPESYGLASTSYDGPLESTPREEDLGTAPLRDYFAVYHPGESWNVKLQKSKVKKPKAEKEQSIEDAEKKKTAVVYLKAAPKEGEEEEAEQSRAEEKEKSKKGRDWSFNLPDVHLPQWKFGGRKAKEPKEGDEVISAAYPGSSDKYEGPLDTVDRKDELEKLPLDVSPTKDTAASTTVRKYFLFGRVRHEGDEDVIDKENVVPESYGLASTSYDGPLESTPREEDLGTAPLRDYSAVYHPGESWNVKLQKSKVKKPKAEKEPSIEDAEKKKTAVVYLKAVPKEGEEEEAEQSSAEEKEKSKKGHDWSFNLPDVHLPHWKFGGRKAKEPKEGEEVITAAYPGSSDKYEGPLDTVDRKDELEKLPLDVSPTKDTAASTTVRKYFLFGRVRHEGDEDVIDKENVVPESYVLASTSYDGPLESTPREEDLGTAPLRDYSAVYHPGESWNVKLQKSKVKKPKAEKEPSIEDAEKKKTAVVYLKAVPKEGEEEEAEQSSAEEKEKSKKGRDWSFNLPDVHLPHWKFGGRKAKEPKEGEEVITAAYPGSSDKYEGPLDTVDRKDELEKLPLVVSPTKDTAASTTVRKYFLFGRVRHEGDEDVIDKENVVPESYGLASTSYDGPLESTPREEDLGTAPLRDYSAVYHPGESWNVKLQKSKVKKPKAEKEQSIEDAEKKKTAVVYLKAAPKEGEEEEAEQSRAEEKEKSKKGRDWSFNLPDVHLPQWKFGGRKAKEPKEGDEVISAAYPGSSDKYEGPLDTVDRKDELEKLPLDVSPTKDTAASTTVRKYFLFGRVRHEGDEDVIDKENVVPESYGLASTSYDGPLESTPREEDLGTAPLRDYSAVYHPGESWNVKLQKSKVKKPKAEKEPSIEDAEKKKTAVVYLKAVPKEGEEEEAEQSSAEEKEKSKKGHDWSFNLPDVHLPHWKFGGRKAKEPKEGEEVITAAYPGSSDKYEGPLDTVDRKDELEKLPLDVSPTKDTAASTTVRKYFLFGRVRHEGDEDVIDKENVVPESYVLASTSYDGPLESTPREEDLGTAPLRDYSAVYHPGESWNVKLQKSKVKKPKAEKEPSIEDAEKKKTAVVYLKAVPKEGEEEEAEQSSAEEKEKSKKGRDWSFNLPDVHLPHWKFGGRKAKEPKEGEEVITAAYPGSSDKYEGPLDTVDRKDELEKLPLVVSPTKDTAASTTVRKYFLFGRVRHEGDEDVIDKENVVPESYGLASTSYDGPLESTPREEDLGTAPLRDYSAVYHPGESWNVKLQKSKVKKPKAEKEPSIEDAEKKKTAVVYLKAVPKEGEEEEAEQSSAEEKEKSKKGRDWSFNLPDVHLPHWKFGGRKAKEPKEGEEVITAAYPGSSDKYEGPLDTVDRKDELEKLPLDVSPTKDIAASTTVRKYFLFGRVRHEGDEDVIDKENVVPESYGLASTSYDGPLESTPREEDLGTAPLRDYSAVYHPGESWNVKLQKSKVKKPKAEKEPSIEDAEKKKTAVVYLKAVPKEDEEEEAEQSSAEEKEKSKKGHDWSFNLPDVHLPHWKFGGRKAKEPKEGEEVITAAHPGSSDKYEGPLDTVDRKDELEKLPLDVSPTKDTAASTTVRKYFLFGRVRHEGDEDVIDKDNVVPESYGLASTSYDGPLESTPREEDLGTAPLRDYSAVYHPGESWNVKLQKSKVKKPKAENEPSIEDAEKKKTAVVYLKAVPKEGEEEEAEQSSAEEKEKSKKGRDWSFNLPDVHLPHWKFGGRKAKEPKEGEEVITAAYPGSSDKYEGPLDTVDRKDELEKLPLDVSPTKDTAASTTVRKYFLFGRVRHEGDEDVIDKDNVVPESYGLASTSYDGPLESTPREEDLGTAPLRDYSAVYHPGESWNVKLQKSKVKKPKAEKEPSIEDAEKKKTAVVYLKAVPKEGEEEEAEQSSAEEKEKIKKGRDWSFNLPDVHLPHWKFGGRKAKEPKEGEEVITAAYPGSSDKYEGPLDTVDRKDELEKLPLDVSPTKDTAASTTVRKYFLFGRVRHEGDEDVIDKENVVPESYGLASTSYDGPLESTPREEDLGTAPLRDYSAVYHPGESWNVKLQKSKVKKPNTEKEPSIEDAEKKKTAVVYLKAVPKEGEEEEAEQSSAEEKEKSKKGRDWSFNLPDVHLPHWKFGGRKAKEPKEGEEVITAAYPGSSDKYEGPLDTVDRKDELEKLPLDVSPTKDTAASTTVRKYFLFGRVRHEGDEDVIDKDNVVPESYGLASTSYDGPLESTPREKDLGTAPLRDYSAVYHPGESWNVKLQKSKVKKPKAEKEPSIEDAEKKKTAVVYLKAVPKEGEEEEAEQSSAEEKKKSKKGRDWSFNLPDVHLPHWKFGGRKAKEPKEGEEVITAAYPGSSDKYEGPLDTVDRKDELEKLPLDVSPTKDTAASTTVRKYFLFGRVRHEGDEDVIDKDNVVPESYGLASTSYDGPLESTPREEDLGTAPLRDYSAVYHPGESWNVKLQKSKVKKPKAEKEPSIEDAEKKKTAVVYLKAVPKEGEEEEAEQSSAEEKEKSKKGRDWSFNLPDVHLPHWKFGGRKAKEPKEGEEVITAAYPGSSDKYEGPLDTVDRKDELEKLPLDVSPTKDTAASTTVRKYFLYGRVRHEGDEDVIDKDNVVPESYGLASTSYDGPLESTPREEDLGTAPLRDYSAVYHPGESWNVKLQKSKVKKPKAEKEPSIEDAEKKKTAVVYLKAVPKEGEEEEAEQSSAEEKEKIKKGRDWSFNLPDVHLPHWKFGGRKAKEPKEGEEVITAAYPGSSDKYEGPLDTVDRKDELEKLPLDVSPTKDTAASTTVRKYFLFGRVRHEGDEDVIDKENVVPESYGLASTSYDGPLESTPREEDLGTAPLRDYSAVYHPGESWNVKLQKSKVKKPKAEKEPSIEDAEKKKTAVVYLKAVPKEGEEEEAEQSSAEEKEKSKKGHDWSFNLPDVHLPHWKFGGRKAKEPKEGEEVITAAYPGSSDKYEGPLDTVDRKDELEKLPLDVSPTKDTAASTTVRKYFLFGRVRHEGDEDVIDKENVVPESYVLASTSYDGPLESTPREEDLGTAPLRDYSAVYHPGESWNVKLQKSKVKKPKAEKEPSIEDAEKKKTAVVYLKAVPKEGEEEEAEQSSAEEKKKSKKGRDWSFNLPDVHLPHWKFGGRKAKEPKEGEEVITAAYPGSSDKYEGPLDTVDRKDELEKLPLDVSPTKDTAASTTVRKYFLFGRVRHEGDEDVIDKENVVPESYGLASTSYDGPLESTPREEDLGTAPLRDYSAVYHPGESWNVKLQKSKVKKPKAEKEPTIEDAEKKKTAVVYLKAVPKEGEEEEAEQSSAEEKEKSKKGRDWSFNLPDVHLPHWKFGGRKAKEPKEGEEVITAAYPGSSDKYEGPLDTVDRKDELEKLPLDVSPTKDTAASTTVRKYFLFGRVRHEGDEDVIDKENVVPESYGLASTSYDGPLESTPREEDLGTAPLRDYSAMYHPGESWNVKLQKSKVKKPKAEKETSIEDAEKKKTAVVYLKAVPKEGEEEEAEQSSAEEKEKSKKGRDWSFNLPDVHLPHWKFGGRKAKEPKEGEEVITAAYPGSSDKYEGPLDTVDRKDELKKLPLDVSPTKDTAASTTVRQYFLFGRVRHEGDEDVIDKENVVPESYGLASTSYDGPLESTPREEDLGTAELRDYSAVYHPGESWNVKLQKSKVKKPKAEKEPSIEDAEKKKTAVVYLKAAPKEGEEEEAEQSRAEEKEKSKKGRDWSFNLPDVHLPQWKFGGRKAKEPKEGEEVITAAYPGSSDKYEGPLDTVDRKDELEKLPLDVSPTKDTAASTTVRKYFLFGRVRHEGDEDVIDKENVVPESYGLASTSYDGPLESIPREEDLGTAPLRDYSAVYHPGESWNVKLQKSKVKKPKTEKEPSIEDAEKKKTAVVYLKAAPKEGEEEEAEQSRAEEKEKSKKGRDWSFNLPDVHLPQWKFGGRKAKEPKEGEEVITAAYPGSSDKYEGPLDTVDRKDELEKLPLDVSPTKDTAASTTVRKYFLFGRVRHEGDEDVIDKENVVPESYGLASTSYDGPLESTPREEDLGTAELRDYSAVYHPGESWNVKLQKSKVKKPKAEKEPSIEDAEKKKTAVVYLKAAPKEGEEEEAEQSRAEEKEKSKKGRDWSFNLPDVHLPQWKFGGRKAKEPKEGEEVITAAYPGSSDKYEGPLDTVDRKDELEKLPLDVSPTKDTAASTTVRKYFLFGRVRHEGDEDVIDKENVVPESYGLASTSYDGPLESTPREEDLGTAPLRDYSAVYHPGESWNVKLQKSKVKKPKAEKEPTIEDAEKKKTAVVYLKAAPKEGEEEEAEQSRAEEKEKSTKGRDWSFNLPDVHLPQWKFGGRKAKEPKEGEEVITAAYPGSSDKYEGPLDTVDRKDELEKLPLDVSPTKDTAASTTVRKYFLFGRVRHEGDEDVIDKENVVPESYGLASTSYDGPLESTPREEDLGTAPLRDYSAVYHPGESWNVKLQKSKVKKPKTEKEPSIEDAEKKKTAVVYLKAAPKEGEEEEAEQSRAEEKEKSKKGRDWSFNLPDVHLPQWKFGGRKAKEPKEGEEVITAAYPGSSDKYEGPLDTVDRKDELEKLPLDVSPTKDTAASTTVRKYFLFGRVRHEGDEDVIDKENVVPESYGLASTSYDGPLESTPREEDLGTAPLRDYSAVYHPGESWNVKLQKSKAKKPKAENEPSIEDAEKKKTAVVYLKAAPKEGEEEEAEQSRAEEKEKSKKGRDWSFNLPDVHLPQWKFGGRKAKEPKEGEEVITAAYPGSSDKYEGPLDTVDRKDELEKLPLDVSPTKDTAASTTVRKYFLFGRVRHEGDEDVIDKENVVPESYGLASTSYDGPLESTPREEDLGTAGLRDYSAVYHPGESWNVKLQKSKVKKPKAEKEPSIEDAEKKKTAVVYLKAAPKEGEEEEAEQSRAEEKEKSKKGRDWSFNLPDVHLPQWKFGGSKAKEPKEGEEVITAAYPGSSDKYEGPLDTVDRKDELEKLPLDVSPTKDTAASTTVRKYFLFGRVRHEGDEDVIDKENVVPESYGLASTSYDGPLESTPREEDLGTAELRDYSAVYHPGESWNVKLQKSKVKKPKTEKEPSIEDAEKKKTAVVYLKAAPKEGEEEEAEQSRAEEKEKSKKGRDWSFNLPDVHLPQWKFGGRKAKEPKEGEEVITAAYPGSSDKYEGPLDTVDRKDELEKLPLDVSPTKDTAASTTVRKYFLFARVRHEGDEDVIDKEKVVPESYGLASTSYDGPLESTPREEDLGTAPLRDYSAVYHPGESWNVKLQKSKVKKPKAEKEPSIEDAEKKKTAVVYLKAVSKEGEEKEAEQSSAEEQEKSNVKLQKDHKLKTKTFARIAHPGKVEIVRKEMINRQYYDFGAEKYSGPLNRMELAADVPSVPIGSYSNVYHDGNSYKKLLGSKSSKGKSYNPQLSDTYLSRPTVELAPVSELSECHFIPAVSDQCEIVEVRIERRCEVQLQTLFCLTDDPGRAVCVLNGESAEISDHGPLFSVTPPPMPSTGRPSFFSRFGFGKRKENGGSSEKKKKSKKGKENADTSSTSSSSEDEKALVVVKQVSNVDQRHAPELLHYQPPVEERTGRIVREESDRVTYRLSGKGLSPQIDPSDPSLSSTIAQAERLNAGRSPRLAHAERTTSVRAVAPLPVSYAESGQPHTTVSTWQETNMLPDEVVTQVDEHGNTITKTIKTQQVKQTVQRQTFQNFTVDGEQGAEKVERVHEMITPLSSAILPTNGASPVSETHTRTVAYEASPGQPTYEGMGEFVSSKTVTSGNRTVETITYKTEKDGIVETHVEHRVTIHSDDNIDHDAELSQAILDATRMNPDMTVEKIEVKQETTH